MSEWQQTTLADVCEFHNGLWKGKKPPYINVGVIRNTNFTSGGTLDETDIAFLDVEERQFSKRQLQYGDIIIEKSGGGPKQPVGRVIRFEKKEGLYSFSNFTSVIRVNDSSVLSYRFLHFLLYHYYISGITEDLQRRSTGIRNLRFKEYKELKVPLPSLSEQEQIVAILDEAFEAIDTAIANTEKNLANTDELLASHKQNFYVSQETSFEKATLGEVCEFFNGKAHEKSIDAEGAFKVVNSKFISSDGAVAKKCAQQMFPLYQNDIVMVMSDVPNGKALAKCLIIDEDDRYTLNQRICAIRTSRLETKYLFHQLNRHPYLLAFNNGENQTNLRKGDILNCPLAIPPIDEQERISEAMDSFDAEVQNLIDNFNEKLVSLNTLKQSVLEKAFSGELSDSVLEEAGV